MTSLTLSLDNVDVSENPEHISKLFPKCRPRSDINLNPIISSNNHDHDRTDNSTIVVMNNDRDNDRYSLKLNITNSQNRRHRLLVSFFLQ